MKGSLSRAWTQCSREENRFPAVATSLRSLETARLRDLHANVRPSTGPEPPGTQGAARKKLTGKKQLVVNTVADEEIHETGAPGGPPGRGASVSLGPAGASHPAGPGTPAEARMRQRVRHGQAHRGRTPPPGAARCSQEDTES